MRRLEAKRSSESVASSDQSTNSAGVSPASSGAGTLPRLVCCCQLGLLGAGASTSRRAPRSGAAWWSSRRAGRLRGEGACPSRGAYGGVAAAPRCFGSGWAAAPVVTGPPWCAQRTAGSRGAQNRRCPARRARSAPPGTGAAARRRCRWPARALSSSRRVPPSTAPRIGRARPISTPGRDTCAS